MKTSKELVKEFVFSLPIRKLEAFVERVQQDALSDMKVRIRKELPEIEPSGGYDELDEVLGLLRVARLQRDSNENELIRLRKDLKPEPESTVFSKTKHG